MAKIAIIGGGVAGVTSALLLDEDVTLFESQDSLISGPPFCHLHAGGNLYPDISAKECLQLLEESIEFLRLYPFSVDFRPTIVAFPHTCNKNPKEYIDRLEIIKNRYKELVDSSSKNLLLGEVEEYYKIYKKSDIAKLKERDIPKNPKSFDEWLVSFAKFVNLDSLKEPIVIVNEYGLNLFRLAAAAKIALKNKDKTKLYLNKKVIDVKRVGQKFVVSYESGDAILQEKFDYLINAAGFKSGKIDDWLGYKRAKFVEFKAAYVTKWRSDIKFAEMIFHGKRGTSSGMAQFTPYNGGYYQLHGMSKEITLFENGLVKTDSNYSQPKLAKEFLDIIEVGWSQDLAKARTKRAIEHFSDFLPTFAKEATVTSVPLYGAQQIPGNSAELRAAEVSFEPNYARCEIVKVSSAIAMAKEIAKRFDLSIVKNYNKLLDIDTKIVDKEAQNIAASREYPPQLGIILNPKEKNNIL
jgi:hypothetical protein